MRFKIKYLIGHGIGVTERNILVTEKQGLLVAKREAMSKVTNYEEYENETTTSNGLMNATSIQILSVEEVK